MARQQLATSPKVQSVVAGGPPPLAVVAWSLFALGVVGMLRFAADLLAPIVVAILIAYALEPIVARLEELRVPRALGAALVVVALIVAGVGIVAGVRDDVVAIVENAPAAARRLRETLRPATGEPSALEKVTQAAEEIEQSAAAAAGAEVAPAGVTPVAIREKPLDVRGYLWTGSMGMLGVASQGALLLFLAYFLLASGDLYRRKLVRIAGPSLTHKRVTLEVLDEISRSIQRFLFTQIATSTLVALASWIAFRALGLENAALWGLAAGVFNTIPYFGPVIVTCAVTFVGFLQFGTLAPALSAGAAALVITSLEGFLLTPWLMGRAARMNEVAVFVGLLFWSWTWGIVGMLLAVPMLAVCKAICDRVDALRPVGELLGD